VWQTRRYLVHYEGPGTRGGPGRGCGRSRIPLPNNSCRWRTSGCCSTAWRRSPQQSPAIQDAVGDGSAFGIRTTYLRQEAPLGLAHAVLIAGKFLGDDDFVMYLGDNFIVGGITELVTAFTAARPDAQIMLTRVPDPRSFGVAELDSSGRVVGLEEKPALPKSDLALVGVYMFAPTVPEAVEALKSSWRGELEITEAIQWLIDRDRTVASTAITGYWKDTGNITDILEVNRSREPRTPDFGDGGIRLRDNRPGSGGGWSGIVLLQDRRGRPHRCGYQSDRVVYRSVHLCR
jgi:hypothetical protein